MTLTFSQTSAAVSAPAGDAAPSFSKNPAAGQAAPDLPLSSQAMAAMLTRAMPATSTAQAVIYPPHAKRGGSLRYQHGAAHGGNGGNPRQDPANAGSFGPEAEQAPASEPAPTGAEPGIHPQDDAPNHPPHEGSDEGGETGKSRKRKSRASATTPEMAAFIGAWGADVGRRAGRGAAGV